MITEPFKAPEPDHFERYENYLARVVKAFEDWANQPITFQLDDGLVTQSVQEARHIKITVAGPRTILAELAPR